MMQIFAGLLVSLMAIVAWSLGIVGLPGNWMIVALAVASWSLAAESASLHMSVSVVLVLLALAAVGELIEFATGALGVKRLGGSTRSTWFAVLGSLVGACAGLVLGSGIPVVGNVIASIIGSALGSLVGAVYGERTSGQAWESSLQVGSAAFIGRLLGTLGKLLVGSAMLAIFLSAIWF